MRALIVLAVACLIVKAIFSPSIKRLERRRAMEIAKIKKAQAEQHRREIELMREQMRQRREQERLAKEQEKQAAQLAKHEEQIANLTFRMERAEQDMEYLNERMRNLMAKRDNYMAQQVACTPLSKDWDKWQTKIISLDNQIHSAESRLAKAQFTHEQAKAKLSA